jgi:hypothetical protein
VNKVFFQFYVYCRSCALFRAEFWDSVSRFVQRITMNEKQLVYTVQYIKR